MNNKNQNKTHHINRKRERKASLDCCCAGCEVVHPTLKCPFGGVGSWSWHCAKRDVLNLAMIASPPTSLPCPSLFPAAATDENPKPCIGPFLLLRSLYYSRSSSSLCHMCTISRMQSKLGEPVFFYYQSFD